MTDHWLRGAMFDLDGTLLDREPLVMQGILRACAAAGLDLTTEEASCALGRAWQDVHASLDVEHRLGWTLHDFIDEVFVHAEAIAAEGGGPRVLPGARELVLAIRDAGIPVALVTGSRHSEVTPALEQLDLVGVFDELVAADDYENGKPSPEPYLLGAHRLGVRPQDCVAFEDSWVGVTSALAAGCAVVAADAANFPEGHPARQDLDHASWRVPSLAHVTVTLLRERLAPGGPGAGGVSGVGR